jgi:hypothetical protein
MAPVAMPSNQNIKKGRGGARANSGRKKGAIQKLSGAVLLDAIAQATGKRFEDKIAEHYHQAALMGDWHAVRDYEKFILSKVLSDHVDITSGGQPVAVQLVFNPIELPEWGK